MASYFGVCRLVRVTYKLTMHVERKMLGRLANRVYSGISGAEARTMRLGDRVPLAIGGYALMPAGDDVWG